MKRFLYLLSFIAVVVLIVLLGFWNRSRPRAPEIEVGSAGQATIPPPLGVARQDGEEGPLTSQGTPPAASGGTVGTSTLFGVVSQTPILDYVVDKGNTILALQTDGRVVRIIDGKSTLVASSTANALSASFSHSGRWVLKKTATGFRALNIASSSELALPVTLQNPSWSPENDALIFSMKNSEGAHAIATLDLGAKTPQAQKLLDFKVEDAVPAWVNAATILVSEKPSAKVKSSLWIYDVNTKVFQTIVSEGFAASALWSPSKDEGLVFTGDETGRGGALSIRKLSGSRAPVGFLTIPQKCAFAKPAALGDYPFLYCAIPRARQTLELTALPDDYLKGTIKTQDDLFIIDTGHGDQTLIFAPKFPLDAINLKIYGNRLFFMNRMDGYLYGVTLP